MKVVSGIDAAANGRSKRNIFSRAARHFGMSQHDPKTF